MVAAAVHPNFRLCWVSDDEERARITRLVVERALSKQRHNEEQAEGEQLTQIAPTSVSADSTTSASSKRKAAFYDRFKANKRPRTSLQEEVERYLNELPDDDLSSLKIKEIRDLYVESNTALPASAAAERLFSLGGRVFTPFRSSLTDEHFEQLVFLRANWKLLGLS
jgi:hypothetical protein